MPLTVIKLTDSFTFLFLRKEEKKCTILYYILIIPIWIFSAYSRRSQKRIAASFMLCGAHALDCSDKILISTYTLHTRRDDSHLKQTLQHTLLWQGIYLKGNRKQLCNFSLKNIFPVAQRNLTGIQAEGREWTSVLHEKILGNNARRREKPQNPGIRMTNITTPYFHWVLSSEFYICVFLEEIRALH